MAKDNKVSVELHDLSITPRKDDRSGQVVSTGSLKIDGLIAIAIARGSDINAATMRAVYDILKTVALGEICGGKHVEFGLSHCGLGVTGVFIGDHPAWKEGEHSLVLRSVPTLEVRNALQEVAVEVRGMASSGMYVNSLTDVASGEVNERLTPGGGVNLTGVKIKLVGDAPEVGIHLTEINTTAVVDVPITSVLTNDPSRLSFIVPADLPAGDYKLSVTSQFTGNSIPLNEPRTYTFDYVLTCG
jgi:hypothetical protein